MCAARGIDHSLVFRRVFIGLEENFVELSANRLGALPGSQLTRPNSDLRRDLLFLLYRCECLLHDLGAGFFEAPFTSAAKIMRRVEQTHQTGRLLYDARLRTEILAGHIRKTKFLIAGKFPSQIHIHAGG